MTELLVITRALFSTVNTALLLVLIWLFWCQFSKLKAQFNLGLLLVMLALLFHTLVMNPGFYILVGASHLSGTYGLLALLADIFESIALAVLLYLSWK